MMTNELTGEHAIHTIGFQHLPGMPGRGKVFVARGFNPGGNPNTVGWIKRSGSTVKFAYP